MHTDPFKNFARMALSPWRERGIGETLRSIHACMHAQRQERIDAFDARHGTDTGRHLSLEALRVSGQDVPALWRYFPTLEAPFRRMLAALPIRFEDHAFIDLGSGKGRALLLASERPFRRIFGVELSPRLHRVAQRNIEIYRSPQQRCRAFELLCMDAAHFSPPPIPAVFYFFQPFPRETMAAVLDRMRTSLRARQRELAIVYLNPLFHDSIMETGLFAHHMTGEAQRPGEFDWTIYLHRP
jgi:hypothetical protein